VLSLDPNATVNESRDSDRTAATELFVQLRKLSEHTVQTELRLAAANRKIKEQAQTIAQLRAGTDLCR
jgi:hypothetical protein